MRTVYSSQVDPWLAAVVGIAVLGSMIAIWFLALSSIVGKWFIIAPLLILSVILPVWTLTTTNYRFKKNELMIRSGPFLWRVPIDEIISVAPTRNILSSPAWSLDRLAIVYRKDRCILISPRNKDEFLEELRHRQE